MRKIAISDAAGNAVGEIIEDDGGSLSGEGKGQSLLEQAPTRTFDQWLENGHHSKYLRYEEQTAA